MLRRLSYPLDPNGPTFMHYSRPRIAPLQSIARRDNVNTSLYELHSNSGTHVIAPRHVHERGYDISQIPVERFHFTRPAIIDVELPSTWLISENELTPHADTIANCDLLLVRTGTGRLRREDPRMYGAGNPGFDVSAGVYLVEKFPDLKAVGMDFVYPSSAHHISRGLAFQQVVLGAADPDKYILLIADMNLEDDLDNLEEVWVLPLQVAGGPSAPCTVVAKIKEPGAAVNSEGDESGEAKGDGKEGS